ncbi:hypothetical protein BVY01_03100 [bacterium I07]|nr:hypothetical protein BVY01_03100 [bacterium I07]
MVAKSKSKEYFVNYFFVAGFQFYDGPKIIARMKVNDEIRLHAEPNNPHDHYAVELYYNDKMIGHIPRSENKYISRLLRQDLNMVCRIQDIRPEAPTWEQVRVSACILVDKK